MTQNHEVESSISFEGFQKRQDEREAWRRRHPVLWFLACVPYRIKHFFYFLIRGIPNEIKYAYQRVTRGWSNRDTWDASGHLAKVAHGMIKHLRDHGHTLLNLADDYKQSDWCSDEKTKEIYDKILWSLDFYMKCTDCESLCQIVMPSLTGEVEWTQDWYESTIQTWAEFNKKWKDSIRPCTKEEYDKYKEGRSLLVKIYNQLGD